MDHDYVKMYREVRLENQRLFKEIGSMHHFNQQKDAKILSLQETISKLQNPPKEETVSEPNHSIMEKFEEDRKLYQQEIQELQNALKENDVHACKLEKDIEQRASDFKLLEKEYVRLEMSTSRLISENEGLKEKLQSSRSTNDVKGYQKQIKVLQQTIAERDLKISFLEWKSNDSEKNLMKVKKDLDTLDTSKSKLACENDKLKIDNTALMEKLSEDQKKYEESIQDLCKALEIKDEKISNLEIKIEKSFSDFKLLEKEFLLTDSSISQLVAKSESLEIEMSKLFNNQTNLSQDTPDHNGTYHNKHKNDVNFKDIDVDQEKGKNVMNITKGQENGSDIANNIEIHQGNANNIPDNAERHQGNSNNVPDNDQEHQGNSENVHDKAEGHHGNENNVSDPAEVRQGNGNDILDDAKGHQGDNIYITNDAEGQQTNGSKVQDTAEGHQGSDNIIPNNVKDHREKYNYVKDIIKDHHNHDNHIKNNVAQQRENENNSQGKTDTLLHQETRINILNEVKAFSDNDESFHNNVESLHSSEENVESAMSIGKLKQEIADLQRKLDELRLDHSDLYKLQRMEKARIIAEKDNALMEVETNLKTAIAEVIQLKAEVDKRNLRNAVIKMEFANLDDKTDKQVGCFGGRFAGMFKKSGRSRRKLKIMEDIIEQIDDALDITSINSNTAHHF